MPQSPRWQQGPLDSIFHNTRRQQLAEVTGEESTLSQQERQQNHYLAISLTALGITSVATLLNSPLIFASVPLLVYTYAHVIKSVIQAFQEERLRLLRTFELIHIGSELVTGYFFASALAATFYWVAERVLFRAESQSQQSLIHTFGQLPSVAWVLANGCEVEADCSQLRAGDIVVVNAGEVIPVDGTIIAGAASIDQHTLTGESQLAEKGKGDYVLAPTSVLLGKIYIEVERMGSETTTSQIGSILEHAAEYRQKVELRSVAMVERFIPPTLLLGAISLPFVGVSRSLALIESTFGYNLRVSGPMSLLNMLEVAARQGILIKDGQVLEQLCRIDTVVFDKTGTLTLEQPHIGAIHTYHGLQEHEVLTWAAAAEYHQTHPIARAIRQAAYEQGLPLPTIDGAEYKVGYGIKVTLNGQIVRVGSERFLAMEAITLPEDVRQLQSTCHHHGYSLVLVAVDAEVVGAIELHPTIRPEAHKLVQQLQQHGLKLSIISGDHESPTRQVAQELGIEHFFAEVLPEEKANLIDRFKTEGRTVCFVGDGINDSIALEQAHVSVSLQGASTAAIDTAQVVLMDGNLHHLVDLLDLGREYQSIMRGNLLLATIPNVLCIGGIYLLQWGIVKAILFYNASLVASMGNAMWPLLKRQFTGNADEQNMPSVQSLPQPEQRHSGSTLSPG